MTKSPMEMSQGFAPFHRVSRWGKTTHWLDLSLPPIFQIQFMTLSWMGYKAIRNFTVTLCANMT